METHHQYDAQGCTEALSDDAGDVLGPYACRAFGLIANASMSGWADLSPDLWASAGADDWGEMPVGPQTNFGGFGRSGAYLDRETELYLMGSGGGSARYYDPVTGRFISEDRIGLAGGDPNLFRYCGNDPINRNDPSGMDSDPHVVRSYRGSKNGVPGTYNVDLAQTDPWFDFLTPAKPPILIFTPDPTRDAAADLALIQALQSALNDPQTPNVITQAEANAIPLDESEAIRILAATGRHVETPYSTKASIDYSEKNSGKDYGWASLRKNYPGLADSQIIAQETSSYNIRSARIALAVDTNPAIRGFMQVFGPTATLIMMSMDLPMLLGQAVRPGIATSLNSSTATAPTVGAGRALVDVPAKPPGDPEPYTPIGVPLSKDTAPGLYCYVRNKAGVVLLTPQGYHVHPLVLGKANWATGAGEVQIISETSGQKLVVFLNEDSGTFKFTSDSLGGVSRSMMWQGWPDVRVAPDAISPKY